MPTREWRLENYLKKLYPNRGVSLPTTFDNVATPKILEQDISDELVEECYRIIAGVIATHGENYLPIFERLHVELSERDKRRKLLDEAFKVANTPP